MASTPLNKIEMAHQIYRDGKYEEALRYYTEALLLAKTKSQKIALHSNRAACYLKLNDFKKTAEECTSVLELDHKHAGALMLRAQTLVTLREYHSSLFDVNRLMELNPSSEVYRNFETRLRTQLSLAPIPESEAELEDEDEIESSGDEVEPQDGKEDETKAMVMPCQKNDIVKTTVAEVAPEIPHPYLPSVISGEQKIEPKKTIASKVIAQAQEESDPRKTIAAEVIAQSQRKVEPRRTLAAEVIAQALRKKESPEQQSKAWQAIPKPKGHSALDYARWDKVDDDSSSNDDSNDDDEEDTRPQYRFRVRTVGVRPVR